MPVKFEPYFEMRGNVVIRGSPENQATPENIMKLAELFPLSSAPQVILYDLHPQITIKVRGLCWADDSH